MRKLEFLVGLFVLAGILSAVFLAIKVGGSRVFADDSFTLNARFTNVGGLNEGSRVVIGGVRVGTVSAIRLEKKDFAAIVELSLDKGLSLHDDTMASIRSSGLIGDKFVSLSPGGSGTVLNEGDTIVDTEASLDIEKLIGNFAFGSIESKKKDDTEGDDLDLDLGIGPPKESGNNNKTTPPSPQE